jgi:hypothetical protein
MGPRPRNHHTFTNRSQIHRDDLFDVYGIVAFWQHSVPGSWVKSRLSTCEMSLDLYDKWAVIDWFVDKASIHSLMNRELNRYFE